jgi:hypothetical protein
VSSFNQIFSFSHDPGTGEQESVPYVPPPWQAPPEDELGTYVAVSTILGRSEQAVVALAGAVAYSSGVTLDVRAVARGMRERDANRFFHEQHLFDPEEEPSPAFLRLGIELPGGERVSNLEGRRQRFAESEPGSAVLVPSGGGGGSSGGGRVSMRPSYWLWPLPAAGALTFFVEWPAVEIALTRTEVDTAPILAAASAVPLF